MAKGVLESVIENLPVAVAVLDRERRCLATSIEWRALDLPSDHELGNAPSSEIHQAPTCDQCGVCVDCHGVVLGELRDGEEALLERLDGAPLRVRCSRFPWREANEESGGVALVAENVTAGNEPAKTEMALRGLMETMPLGVHIYRLEGEKLRFVGGNPASERILKLSVDELRGQELEQAFPRTAGTEIPQRYRDVARGGDPWVVDELEYADDQVRGTFNVRAFNSGAGEVVVIFDDVSEHSYVRERLARAEKMEAVAQLAGGMAHDFNNVLTGIIGLTELAMMQMSDDEPAAADLQRAIATAQEAASMTRQLLTMSRQEPVAASAVDLDELLRGCKRMIKQLVGEDIELVIHHTDEPLWIHGDRGLITQAILNVALNARDAMPDGGTIVLETQRQTIREHDRSVGEDLRAGDYAVISISDTGYGMDKVTVERAVEPFFTTKGVGEGTGLGLSSVYGTLKQHDGFVGIYSEPGLGTTVRLSLPCRVEAERVECALPELQPSGTGKRVLIAEDNPAVLQIIERCLDQLGYETHPAENPADALRVAASLDDDIDILITDVVMPGSSGFDLHEALSARQPKLMTLFISGYAPGQARRHERMPPGATYLAKPFTMGDLAAELEALTPAA